MTARDCFDAVVVGAGPAGSATALCLAARGFRALLIDRGVPGERAVCGGFLGPELAPFWKSQGIEREFSEFPKKRIGGVLVSGRKGLNLTTPFKKEPGWAVDRAQFDRWLCERAQAAGVVFSGDTTVGECKRPGGVWDLRLDRGEKSFRVCSRFLIKAHGRRQSAQTGENKEKAFFACKTVYRNVRGLGDWVALHFVGRGHVGLNPLEDGRVTLCLYVEGRILRESLGNLDRMMERLAMENPNLREHLKEAKRISAWQSCQAEPDGLKIFFKDGVFFAGDAVTMVNPIVGGGIPVALGSAKTLAMVLTEGARRGKNELQMAMDYRRSWSAQFNRRLRWAGLLGRLERSAAATSSVFYLLETVPQFFQWMVGSARPI